MDLLDRFDMVDRVTVVDIEDRVNKAAMEMIIVLLRGILIIMLRILGRFFTR